MANDYYERLSEMNPGDLADGLAMEAEFDAIAQAFGKLPTPHIGGQGFDGPVRVGDALNGDEAVSLGQLQAAIGKATLLSITTYGDLNAADWAALPSGSYLLFGTGSQFINFPATLVSTATYSVLVHHAIGGVGASIYHDELALHSSDDANNVDMGRLISRIGRSLLESAWSLSAFKIGGVSALEGLTPAENKLPYYTGVNSASLTPLTPFARTLLDDQDAATAIATLGAYSKGNAVGAVSQSGGVLTGAIFERGSNANGEYIKFADGTMICRHSITVSAGPPIAQGALFRSPSAFSRAYPAAFVAPPVFNGLTTRNGVSGGTSYIGLLGVTEGALDTPSATEIPECYYMATSSWSSLSARLHYIAIGRWY